MSPAQITTLRIMVGDRLKPNGYFYGVPGVAPDGEVSREILKKSPDYTDSGVVVYYKYLVEMDNWQTDTFRFYFGSKP